MSAPLSSCLISKAAHGDETAYKELLSRIIYNLTRPAYSILSCTCNPPCPEPTEQQFKKLNAQIDADLKVHAEKTRI